jgi:hypothetical protein
MAFTGEELARGGVWTWLVFLALVALIVIVPEFASTLTDGWVALWSGDDAGSIWSARIVGLRGAPVLLIALVVCGMLSGLVALVVTPLAGLVGRGLARVFGTVRSICAPNSHSRGGAGVALDRSPERLVVPALVVIASSATAVAAASGWWLTSHKALRDDVRTTAARSDPS